MRRTRILVTKSVPISYFVWLKEMFIPLTMNSSNITVPLHLKNHSITQCFCVEPRRLAMFSQTYESSWKGEMNAGSVHPIRGTEYSNSALRSDEPD